MRLEGDEEPLVGLVSLVITSQNQRLSLISYRATLDLSRELVRYVAALLQFERHQRGTRAGTRKLRCFWQAVVGPRWFRDLRRRTGWPVTTGFRVPRPITTWKLRSRRCSTRWTPWTTSPVLQERSLSARRNRDFRSARPCRQQVLGPGVRHQACGFPNEVRVADVLHRLWGSTAPALGPLSSAPPPVAPRCSVNPFQPGDHAGWCVRRGGPGK